MRIGHLILIAALSIVAQPEISAAQTSEAELLKKFEAQKNRHRGLSLGPVTSTAGQAAGQAAAEQAAKPKPATTTTGSTATATTQSSSTQAAAKPATATKVTTSTAAAASTGAPSDFVYVQQGPDTIDYSITFDINSATMRPGEFDKLTALCNAVKQANIQDLVVIGHTDASGSAAHNLRLSKRRAEEVRNQLVQRCGIPASTISAYGFGEQYLLPSVPGNAAANRRVEFQARS